MKEFARAGRIDDWKGHLAVMENCWIFLNFSENGKLYLQKMAELETGYPWLYQQFTNTGFRCVR